MNGHFMERMIDQYTVVNCLCNTALKICGKIIKACDKINFDFGHTPERLEDFQEQLQSAGSFL